MAFPSARLTATTRAAWRKAQRTWVRRPGICATWLMSLPMARTTTGTPVAWPRATAAVPSGNTQGARITSGRKLATSAWTIGATDRA
jgi:hypothetical protein